MNITDVIERARANGWTVTPTNGGHIRLSHPQAQRLVVTASTASDWRAGRNLAAQLRRALPADPAPRADRETKRRKKRRRPPSPGYSHPTARENLARIIAEAEARKAP